MKNLITLLIVVSVLCAIGVVYHQQKIADKQNVIDNKNVELLKMKGQIQEDSLTISTYVRVISDRDKLIERKDKEFMALSRKYETISDAWLSLKLMNDSLLSLNVVVEKDTVEGQYTFTTDADIFKIYGHIFYGRHKPMVTATMSQVSPLYVDISLEKTAAGNFVAFAKTNSSLLNINKAEVVKFIDKKRWIDECEVALHLPINELGIGTSFYYKNYGLSYIKYESFGTMVLNYKYNLGELF